MKTMGHAAAHRSAEIRFVKLNQPMDVLCRLCRAVPMRFASKIHASLSRAHHRWIANRVHHVWKVRVWPVRCAADYARPIKPVGSLETNVKRRPRAAPKPVTSVKHASSSIQRRSMDLNADQILYNVDVLTLYLSAPVQ